MENTGQIKDHRSMEGEHEERERKIAELFGSQEERKRDTGEEELGYGREELGGKRRDGKHNRKLKDSQK